MVSPLVSLIKRLDCDMMDYVKAALYTVLIFGGLFGVIMFLGTFPGASIVILGTLSVSLMFYAILSAIRSQRKLNEIRSRYQQ